MTRMTAMTGTATGAGPHLFSLPWLTAPALALAALFVLSGLVVSGAAEAVEHTGAEVSHIEVSEEAVERGRTVFMEDCRACHGLEYYRDRDYPDGVPPMMDASTAASAFGVEPPDLTLMAVARGKGLEGVSYIYRLLTTYYRTPAGELRNRAFAEETESEGVIAMPQPISADDPELEDKSMDVAVFLHHVAEPTAGDRRSLGTYVVGYMVVLTVLLYVLNRLAWKGVRKKLDL